MLSDHIIFLGKNHFKVKNYDNPSFTPHIHLSFELITVLEGEITLTVDNTVERLSAGESALIFSHQIHSIESTRARCRLCTFSPWITISFYTLHQNRRPVSNRFVLPPLLMQTFLELEEDPRHYKRKGFLYQVIDAFDENRKYVTAYSKTNSLTVKILSYIEENYMGECTLKSLSEALDYDPNYLSQTFMKNVGMHFKEYVTFIRLSRTCYLLEFSQLSILACAEEAGFVSLRSFNRNFKERFGLTPNEYRQVQRSNQK